MPERRYYEQGTIGNYAGCDGCKAACRGAAAIQSRGIQPAEQPGFSHSADWRTEVGDETGFAGVAAEPHQWKELKTQSQPNPKSYLSCFFKSACPAIRLFFENFPITIVRR